MRLDPPIDTFDFLSKGYAQSRLAPVLSNSLLRGLARLEYTPMPADHCDAGPRSRGNIEHQPEVANLLRRLWLQLASSDLEPLHRLFNADPNDHVINVIRLGNGYSLDWHNHLRAGPGASLLLYLFSGSDPGQGGDLVLGRLQSDLRTVHEVDRLKIKHGDLILLGDTTHPLLQHKAEKWHGSGWRYLISFAFNARDW